MKEYDENGNLLIKCVENTDGSTTIIEYDEEGNKVREIFINPDGDEEIIEY